MRLSKENQKFVDVGKRFTVQDTRDGWTVINPDGSFGMSFGPQQLACYGKIKAEKEAARLNDKYV